MAGVEEIAPILHAVSGAMASSIGLAATYPLLTVSTRLQVQKKGNAKESNPSITQEKYSGSLDCLYKIINQEGWKQLYGGLGSSIVGTTAAGFIFYYLYQLLRRYATGGGKGRLTARQSLFVASIAGALNVIITNPIWVVSTNLQTRRKTKGKSPTVNQIIKEIHEKDGIFGFWRGVWPSLVLVSNPTIQYMVFERLKLVFQKRNSRDKSLIPLTSTQLFLMAAIGKVVATAVTYPYIVLKSRQQSSTSQASSNAGMLEQFVKIVSQEGVLALFDGIETKLLQSVLNASILFLMQDRIIFFLLKFIATIYQ